MVSLLRLSGPLTGGNSAGDGVALLASVDHGLDAGDVLSPWGQARDDDAAKVRGHIPGSLSALARPH